MIESFENGIRLTDPDNDRKLIETMMNVYKNKLSHIQRVKNLKIKLHIWRCIAIIELVLIFLLLIIPR